MYSRHFQFAAPLLLVLLGCGTGLEGTIDAQNTSSTKKGPAAERKSEELLTCQEEVKKLREDLSKMKKRFKEMQEERLTSIKLVEIFKPSPKAANSKEVIVNITKQGEYFVGDQKLSERQLIALMHQLHIKNPHQRVQIRAYAEVKYKFPLTVIGICKQENIPYSCTVLEQEKVKQPKLDKKAL